MDARAATSSTLLNGASLPDGVPVWAIVIGVALFACLIGAMFILMRPKTRYSRPLNSFADLKRRADEHDDAAACREVFLMLHEGRGVSRDAEAGEHYRHRAIRLYKAGARRGDAHACMRAAELIDHGRVGTPSNEADPLYHKALTLYEPQAQRGNTYAQLITGHLYRYGLGCKQNFDTAAAYWQSAATARSLPAIKRLAEFHGPSGPKADAVKSQKWWRAAALMDDAEALERVGDGYRDNMGEPSHREEAYRWYAYAARRGRHGVKAKLEQIEKDWTPVQIMDVQNRLKSWTPAAST